MGLDNNLKKMQADREAKFGLKPAAPKPGPQAKAPAKPGATPPKK